MKTLLYSIALAVVTTVCQAQSVSVILDPIQDGGGTRSGFGIFNLTLTGDVLTITGEFSGLSGNFRDAHIHAAAPAGLNAGVLYGLSSFIAPGINPGAGTINATVNLVDNANNRGFSVATQKEQLASGLWYFNIHSSTFTGGEIRGQINPVPEPSTIALGVLGLGGLALWRSRRRA
jgi:MYXO-CTERM domain-containing protein